MPRPGWTSISLPDELIVELKAELEKDNVFKSMASLIIHVMRMYMKDRTRDLTLTVEEYEKLEAQ